MSSLILQFYVHLSDIWINIIHVHKHFYLPASLNYSEVHIENA